jgi:hypothetical protein
MTLQEALNSRHVRSLVDSVVAAEINAAFGRDVLEAPALPARPHDRSLVDALLSPPVVGYIRGMAREQVRQQKKTMKGVASMEQRRQQGVSREPSLAILEARRERVEAEGRRHAIERYESLIPSEVPEHRPTRALQVLETLQDRPAAEAESTAPVSPWRERMLARGVRADSLEGLGGVA